MGIGILEFGNFRKKEKDFDKVCENWNLYVKNVLIFEIFLVYCKVIVIKIFWE